MSQKLEQAEITNNAIGTILTYHIPVGTLNILLDPQQEEGEDSVKEEENACKDDNGNNKKPEKKVKPKKLGKPKSKRDKVKIFVNTFFKTFCQPIISGTYLFKDKSYM